MNEKEYINNVAVRAKAMKRTYSREELSRMAVVSYDMAAEYYNMTKDMMKYAKHNDGCQGEDDCTCGYNEMMARVQQIIMNSVENGIFT